jgi:hypothetical protein
MSGETLPRAREAFIPSSKLRDYVLCLDHPLGRHKARVFRSALGVSADNWEHLRDQIKQGVVSASVSNVQIKSYGVLYEVPILIQGLNGASHEVITAWIVEGPNPIPRLTTAYVNVP